MSKVANQSVSAPNLAEVVEHLLECKTFVEISGYITQVVRDLIGADGVTFVLRDGELCFYADESAIAPLWKGKRFPLEACISGWSMLNRQTVIIGDIYSDPRIPHDAYRPTFVKSLCMVPIRVVKPLGALGAYWKTEHLATGDEVLTLQIIANSAAVAMQNVILAKSVEEQSERFDALESERRELELKVHMMVHDMRTPITTLALASEMLSDQIDGTGNPGLKKLIDSVSRAGMRMNGQVERLLALYRSTNGILEVSDIDFTRLATEICGEIKIHAKNRSIQFDVHGGMSVQGDPNLIRIAVENLLTNAVKYTQKKQVAEISIGAEASSRSGFTKFYFKDNGDGFDQKMSDKLFVPLSRLHTNDEFAGHGLGLASVARIVELHGGFVSAEGRKGEGAVFYLELPNS